MPAPHRRFSLSRSIVETAPSVPSKPASAKCEAQSALTPKTRRQGARPRRSSILKRTASLPVTTAGLIYRTMTKGEDDSNCAVTSQEQNILPSILDLSEPSGPRSPPERTAPSSAAGAGITTFFTAVSSTRPIVTSGVDDFCLGRSGNPLTVLTPCASMVAMYSGMVGRFKSSTDSGFLCNVDVEYDTSSPLPSSSILHSGSGWFWFLRRWKSISWLVTTRNQATGNRNGQSTQEQVSPWLTICQLFVIMLLSVSLYRNMEIVLGW